MSSVSSGNKQGWSINSLSRASVRASNSQAGENESMHNKGYTGSDSLTVVEMGFHDKNTLCDPVLHYPGRPERVLKTSSKARQVLHMTQTKNMEVRSCTTRETWEYNTGTARSKNKTRNFQLQECLVIHFMILQFNFSY